MSLLLIQPSKLCFRKPMFVRSSPLHSDGFSFSLPHTPPCQIIGADPCCGGDVGRLIIKNVSDRYSTYLEKKVPMELFDPMVTIGSSNGWVATLKEDGIVRLQDDLNPVASETEPKRISLPPLVTLPHCQTQIVTNVAMSSSSPEDEDCCVVAVKFLGPQLSFCRPARSNPEWINVKIENPCFFSSHVMYSKKDDMFRIPGSGGHVIGSWDLKNHTENPKLQSLRFQNLPKLRIARRDLLKFSCYTSEHLVESRTTGEIFLVKMYKKFARFIKGTAKLKTELIMVFEVNEEGNAVYTDDIGGLVIFLSKAEPFCLPASSFPGMYNDTVKVLDVGESARASLKSFSFVNSRIYRDGFMAPYYIPPQEIHSLVV